MTGSHHRRQHWLSIAAGLLCWVAGIARAVGAADATAAGVIDETAGAPVARAGAAPWSRLAQPVFDHLTPAQGLPNIVATAIAEDSDGFLWVGTYGGLARWDGYRFHVYERQSQNPRGLPDNFIQALHRDVRGTLWIGTSAAGLVRYERETDAFTALPVSADGISHASVRAIADDGDGGLWVGSNGGLDRLDAQGRAVGHWRHDPADPESLPHDRVLTLLRDRRGSVWVGTENGLVRLDASSGRFQRITIPHLDGLHAAIWSLALDEQDRVWVGTFRHGAFLVVPGVSEPVVLAPAQPRDAADFRASQIAAIVDSGADDMWLGTFGQGIFVVNKHSLQMRRVQHDPALESTLADDSIRAMHRDQSGLIWSATHRGLSRHAPGRGAVDTVFGGGRAGAGLSGADASWLYENDDGRVWVGFHKNGIDIVDPASGSLTPVRPDVSRPDEALPNDIVLAMVGGDDGEVFVGTFRGLYRVSRDGGKVRRMHLAGRPSEAPAWALLRRGGVLWVGGFSDGLWRLDLASDATQRVAATGPGALSDQRVFAMADAGDGTFWVGTRNGLDRYDPASGVVERLQADPMTQGRLAAGFITALQKDARQRLWIGTFGGGLHRMDSNTLAGNRHLQRITLADGLPNDNVDGIVEADDGHLWVSTDDGVAVVDPTANAVRALHRADGLAITTYWTGSATRTRTGDVLFGGTGGVTVVRPHQLGQWNYRPPVVLTDVRLGGYSLALGPYNADMARPIVVPPDAGSIAVEFAALDYSAPERTRYAFRLRGVSDDWIPVDPVRRVAAFTNLAPGSYAMVLRATSRSGATSERHVPIVVMPAWHQTWWFRVALAIGVVGVMLALVHIRTAFLRRRRDELERKVLERTLQLQAASRALEDASLTDPLTGLRNRRFLSQQAADIVRQSLEKYRRAPGEATPRGDANDLVILLVDIDHFKYVNDDHGHGAGDYLLVQIARRIQAVLGPRDHAVRWGGEEFLVLARCPHQQAAELAEVIRRIVAATPFEVGKAVCFHKTCSVGFACIPFVPLAPEALGWEDVTDIADIALYAAKRAGRDGWVGLQAETRFASDLTIEQLKRAPAHLVDRGVLRVVSSFPQEVVRTALSSGL
ncbi:ligand-binding sensor domain-containing diguanylate cyclase [Tahibacter amnicola]|uniref:diguanylate cyclase n=1 Tax=Tahibacter amnicola TaxID=2976241 RepID=A0ABY6BFP4_9GAMM|nr:two-component regulator propeller domain-containing protein [Tahibacter amnicola]UXI68083.1 diguanylate cyclase [Tahibacter amnicola]